MTKLISRPLRRCPASAYPTTLEVLADPELLRRHVPPAWLKHKEVAGALGAFLAANAAGCSGTAPGTGSGYGSTGVGADAPAIVAPMFEHGDGRGRSRWTLACIAVAAPTYLPEEEAIAIIRDELARQGLPMSQRDVELSSVIIRGRELKQGYEWVVGQRGWEFIDMTGPLEVDLMDPRRGVAVEYVAREDFDRLGGDDQAWGAMDIKRAAASLASEVARQGRGVYFGAFYDPVKHFGFGGWADAEERGWASSKEEARAEAARLLREQVKDFVDWLKAQGVI
jgi:hypothetical protein